jgi:hypothetical protein
VPGAGDGAGGRRAPTTDVDGWCFDSPLSDDDGDAIDAFPDTTSHSWEPGIVVAYPLVSAVLACPLARDGTATLIARRRGLVADVADLRNDIVVLPRTLLSKPECDAAWMRRDRGSDDDVASGAGAMAQLAARVSGIEAGTAAAMQTAQAAVQSVGALESNVQAVGSAVRPLRGRVDRLEGRSVTTEGGIVAAMQAVQATAQRVETLESNMHAIGMAVRPLRLRVDRLEGRSWTTVTISQPVDAAATAGDVDDDDGGRDHNPGTGK